MSQSAPERGRAIVIGGSMAGLLAARVLSDHFQEVTVIEREGLATSADPRKAVPQGRHVHVLLDSGIKVIEHLFPDLLPALVESERAVRSDISRDFRWRHFGVWKARFNSGIDILFIYRPSFEWNVAARVSALPNIKVLTGCEVTGFAASARKDRIVGAKIRHIANGDAETLSADLVVDASGRGSQTPKWLHELGLNSPSETRVEVNIGYASRTYARPPDLADQSPLFVLPQAPATRGGAVFPIEGNRWMVTLAGWVRDYPPAGDNEFLEFARSLDVPDLYRCLEKAEPLTPIAIHKYPASVWRRYEKLDYMPESLIVLGDALCSFNPVYAQGMTVAALEAMMLDRILGEHPGPGPLRGISNRFQRMAASVVRNPWLLATGEDLRYPAAEGDRPPASNLVRWYVGAVHKATSTDERVARQFYRVMSLAAPPSSLFTPGIVLRAAARLSLK
jgi:2-polyprenyl-6-methoxyphenol hydroxylase-like FAD-dependent oxidoreductase